MSLDLYEVDAQPYKDARFSSGLIHDDGPDDIYLKFERDGEEPTIITLRQDEAVRIAALLANAVWSAMLHGKMTNEENQEDNETATAE
jgi:hypothetical protein